MTTSALISRRTTGILLLVCVVQFMDIIDAAILNVALPSIERSLDFTQQSLQWVHQRLPGHAMAASSCSVAGPADLLGRRRMLVAGTTVFALFSLAGGLAPTGETLVIARIAQGAGAALMAPAGLSILTTTFTWRRTQQGPGCLGCDQRAGRRCRGLLRRGADREAPAGAGCCLVNIPICVAIVVAAFRLRRRDHRADREGKFDLPGAVLVTAGDAAAV